MTEEAIKIKTLISEIKFELEKVLSLKEDMGLLKESFEHGEPDRFECSAAGYLLHNFYNGVENIFKSIASVYGNKVNKEEWHSALLKRMILEIEDIRPRVITTELYKKLLEYKNFRHFFRHAYLFELDWNKMKGIVEDFEMNIEQFDSEIKVFLKEIRSTLE